MTSVGPYSLDDIYCGDSAVMLAALPNGCLSKQFSLKPSQRPGIGAIVNITIILTDVTRLAQGLDVVNVATSPLANRFDMIGRQLHIIAPASQAPVSVMIAQCPKLCGGIRTTCFRLSGAATVGSGIGFIRICLLPSPLAICYYTRILLPITAIIIRPLVRVICMVASLFVCHRVGVSLFPLSVSIAPALLAVSPLIPFTRSTLFTWQSVRFSHQKSSFALVAKGALKYTLFAASADTTVRHALEMLTHLPGLLFFRPLIIPNLHITYHKYDLARRRVAAANVPLPLFVEQPAKLRQDVLL